MHAGLPGFPLQDTLDVGVIHLIRLAIVVRYQLLFIIDIRL